MMNPPLFAIAEQLQKLTAYLWLVTLAKADLHDPNHAASINDVRGRHSLEKICRGTSPRRIEHDVELRRVALEKPPRILGRLVNADRNDLQALVPKFTLQLVHERKRLPARR